MRNNILVFCLYTLVFMSCREVFGNFNAANDCEDTECGSNNKNSDEPIYEVITVIPKPVELPESLSMVSEEDAHVFEPTVVSTIAEEPKGRSLNFTLDEHSHNNDLTKNNNTKVETNNKKKVIDLSDVDMDNDYDTVLDGDNVDDDTKGLKMNQGSKRVCEKGGLTYENGEKLEVGCDSICTCTNGKMDCIDRCSTPYFKKGKKIEDPLCVEQPAPDDNCCSMLSCSDTATEAIEFCSYNNKTYNRGETVRNDCEKVCHCAMGGKITCKDSCESPKKISKKCFLVPDPDNTCCKKVLCDVNHTKGKIISAKFINKTTIKVDFDTDSDEMRPLIDLSNDKINWKTFTLLPGDYLHGIEDKVNFIRIENEDDIMDIEGTTKSAPLTQNNCTFNGKNYKIGQEFNDGCKSICVCKTTGVKCLKLECPTYFGTDIIDPNCIEWETVPADFKPIPPKCCPDQLKCKYNGSCMYDGRTYDNHQEIPTNLTGCEKRCYCEMGEVECQNVCAPVPPTPPRNLPCPPSHATLKHRPGDDCCLEWMCQKLDLPPGLSFSPTFPQIPAFPPQQHQEILIQHLEAIDPHTVKLSIEIPTIFVGFLGTVEVRYTNTRSKNVNEWKSETFAPPNDILATSQLEFELSELIPDQSYQIKVSVTFNDVHNVLTSKIYQIKTPKLLPSMIPIEPDLNVSEVNSTWAVVSWRKFADNELQFIDGVQLRYKVTDGKIFDATTLIHRAVTSYTLENLRPETTYEVGIYFIPFTNQKTELRSDHMISFTTGSEMDAYGFNVSLEILQVKPTSVEISWKGVPYPEDKYVNIYRAIYQSDSGKGDYSTFKMAKRDSPSKTVIMDLKPGTRYRLWLEVYLTSGRIKTSNVQDFITKPGSAPTLGASSIDKLSGNLSEERGDYYGSLVFVAILATIAILSTLVLLLILIRRHSTNKASITPPPRVTQAAYDNPTYKVEIQQETMGL
ncbi:putative epidermal cell surface receptor isoform X2 [Onthophagus taurus]|uniref:putative epidermal cell surface receptor isoform X2 n=1 Tax=Onthophagus taurus TaxID=166361 RepID=UPI0039BE71C9